MKLSAALVVMLMIAGGCGSKPSVPKYGSYWSSSPSLQSFSNGQFDSFNTASTRYVRPIRQF